MESFLRQDFDPVDYLNTTLRPLAASTTNKSVHSTQHGRSASLPELSTQLQTLLAQLGAQTAQLSNTLTQMTDEIIRSGGRLAYEVEVLRGETLNLTDSFNNQLEEDINVFKPMQPTSLENKLDQPAIRNGSSTKSENIARLEMLATVREKLDSVVKVFGEAMEWHLAPSDVSIASSLISVTRPDTEGTQSHEEKGKAYSEHLRNELNELVGSSREPADLETANARVEHLRQLAVLWKGTSEEKARLKFVEALQKLIDDKHKSLARSQINRTGTPRATDYRYGDSSGSRLLAENGYGFVQNIKNLKNDIYLD